MPEQLPAYLAPTFAERRKAREAEQKAEPDVKQVAPEADEVEDKAVSSATTKKRTARKRS